MDKLLYFQDRNFDQVWYPFSKLRGISRGFGGCGGCLYFHFDGMKNESQPDDGGDIDVDYVVIKFTDASVMGTVIRNIMTNIYAEKTGIVKIIEIFGDEVRNHAFNIKGSDTRQYLCTPENEATQATCSGTAWTDVVTFHVASDV
jgi:hypothetical protein